MMDEANEEYEERLEAQRELRRNKEAAMRVDAERYRWLRCGGWEVLQDPKYWRPELGFDGAVDAARLEVALDAAMQGANA